MNAQFAFETSLRKGFSAGFLRKFRPESPVGRQTPHQMSVLKIVNVSAVTPAERPARGGRCRILHIIGMIPAIGDTLPDLPLWKPDGSETRLSEYVGRGPLLVIFIRHLG